MALGVNRQKSTFDVGQFRTWVQFRTRTTGVDDEGFETVETTDSLRTKVLWMNGGGSYGNRSAGVEEEHSQKYLAQSATIVMRYSNRIAVTDECEKGGVTYEVISINDFEDGHHFMKLELAAKERTE